ncbi:MAG: ElyC/SanA/YdcF family protein [Acidobacteriaceae bacterium]
MKRRSRLLLPLLIVCLFAIFIACANRLLVMNTPAPCDAVLVLDGETSLRIDAGIALLRRGMGQHLFLDVANGREYGVERQELAQRYLSSQLPFDRFTICRFEGDATILEAEQVRACLAAFPEVRSILLVTHDFHSRRAWMVFRQIIPRISFRVAGVSAPYLYRAHWWHTRENFKMFVESMSKMLWYLGVERWMVAFHWM